MRFGLLQCDHVSERFRGVSGGDYDAMFRRHFARFAPEVELRAYDVTAGELPSSPGECDGYLTTGSKASVYDDEPWIERLGAFVRTLVAERVGLVGICFGHQLLAEALGGKVRASPRGWGVGAHTFEVRVREPWMTPPLACYSLLMSCRDQVEVLPEASVVLAGNAFCPIGMFRVGERALGVQAHPEFEPAYAEALMRARVERIGEQRVREALETLSTPLHQAELTCWIVRFLVGC